MKVLIIDDLHPVLTERFTARGWTVDYKPDISVAQVDQIIHRYDILILRSKLELDQGRIRRAENLKIIGRCGAGLDNIDVEYAEKCGIAVFSANEGNRDAVAEHVIGFILGMLHHLFTGNEQVRRYTWDREANRGVELRGKTVGIIGYGFMGKAVARRLKAFGCRIMAYDKYLRGFSDECVEEVALKTLQQESDIISLHIPLNDETRYRIDDAFFKALARPVYLVNSSRGKIVKLEDLYKNIVEGRVISAALDVLENEDFETFSQRDRTTFENLLDTRKVFFTPHVAGWSLESYRKLSEVLSEKILRVARS